MTEPREYHKNPDATQDIRCTWPDLRPGERIVSSRWSAMGLTVVAEQVIADDTVTVGWIAGGLDRTRYHVTNVVMTNLGRQLIQLVVLRVNADVPMPEEGL
jgi:hypothetical protein